jgi:hypothetical protein
VTLSMWVFHLRLDCSVTPRYFLLRNNMSGRLQETTI